MKGSETQLLSFLESNKNRYIIPVYQRKYDWKIENCRQLYKDLKDIIINHRNSHFFGSIVSQVVPAGSYIEYHIIDGQQRITTVTLLLLAICNLAKEGKVHSDNDLYNQIRQCYLIDNWYKDDSPIKLRPVKEDREALEKIFAGDPHEYINTSNMTINYQYFYEQILKEEVDVDELYNAIGKLQIICITLEHDDNAQLIFESLNSTGLALTEGDKIRNYILMGLNPQEQNACYENYWAKIEKNAGKDVSSFVRDYLSIKQHSTPTISKVYQVFKNYVEDGQIPLNTLMQDMLDYARIYKKITSGKSCENNKELDDCLYRLNRLEITVAEPFFMQVFYLYEKEKKLCLEDLTKIFQITENYLFRRNICEVPSNALTKIFLNLHREIIHFDGTANQYLDKFIFALLSKKESGRFPDNEEFSSALSRKEVYQMRGKYKAYLFERFENFGTLETKDVYTLLDNGTYSIEHIMPQHLTPTWKEDLGEQADEIHDYWLHKLANLTLTAYNSKMSNAPFAEKRDGSSGYKKSGLRLNQFIASQEHWGKNELEQRSIIMVNQATNEIWPIPTTSYKPAEKEYDYCSLDDDSYELTGRNIFKYSYKNTETPVKSWIDMYEHIIKYLHSEDKSVLTKIVSDPSESSCLSTVFSNSPSKLRSPMQVDDHIYGEKNLSTESKISILRKLFIRFGANPQDLTFYLRDNSQSDSIKSSDKLRLSFWNYALPLLKQATEKTRLYRNAKSIASTTITGSFGVSGFAILCVVNFNRAYIQLYLGKSDESINKEAFDYLMQNKEAIEKQLGVQLSWFRSDENKASWIVYEKNNVSMKNEEDWATITEFFSIWSNEFYDVFVPMLVARFKNPL